MTRKMPPDPSRGDSKVTRFEVIDADGRVYTAHEASIDLSYQDDGKTLKVFVRQRRKDAEGE